MPDFYKEDKGHTGFGHNVTPFPGIHQTPTTENDAVEEDIILHMEDLILTDFPLNIQNAILNHDRKKVIKERTIEEEKVEISKLLGEIDEDLFVDQEREGELGSYSEMHRAELEKLCRESDLEANQMPLDSVTDFEEKEIVENEGNSVCLLDNQAEVSGIFAELQRLKQKQIEPELVSAPLPPRSNRKRRKKEKNIVKEEFRQKQEEPKKKAFQQVQVISKSEEPQVAKTDQVEEAAQEAEKFKIEAYPNIVYAGFWLRTFAYLIDILMVGSFNRIVVNNLNEVANFSLLIGPFSLNQYIQFFVFVLYFMLFTKINNGQTIGKMIFDLRVVSLSGDKLTWGTIILREGLGRYVQKIFLPLYLMVGFTPKKQHLVDMVSKTSVISENLVNAYKTK